MTNAPLHQDLVARPQYWAALGVTIIMALCWLVGRWTA